jgi:hypothetical protein
MLPTLRTVILLFAQLLFIAPLVGCASPGPEFTAWYKELASTTARPAPKVSLGTPRSWKTYDGADAGTEGGGLRVFEEEFRYFRIRFGVLMRLTDKDYWVGCDRICVIQIPSADGSYKNFERYGPTLRSVRAGKEWEQRLIKAGGDIVYVTGEGVFRASAVTD